MNLEVLVFLLDNEHYIVDMANDSNLNFSTSIGIVKLLLANKGNLSTLTGKQAYHYETVIQPLLESVQCDGPIGTIENDDGNLNSSCVNGGIVDDESLFQSYLEEDFKCQICRYDSEKMG
ncbi:MAG: hypothetical protein GQ475_03160 [Methylococcaceae bacterium]|nr:hypothetical protein [Methylococcaceae bacterium]